MVNFFFTYQIALPLHIDNSVAVFFRSSSIQMSNHLLFYRYLPKVQILTLGPNYFGTVQAEGLGNNVIYHNGLIWELQPYFPYR